jgi:uncharacterized protein YabE (DUF348 family)
MKLSKEGFKNLSITKKALLIVGGIFVIAAAANQPANVNTSNTSDKATQTQTQQDVTTNEVAETEAIPFDSTTADDPTLAKGTTKITTTGVNGTKTLTYVVTYVDGKQTSKQLKSSAVTTQPINQVTAIGTYEPPVQPSCPNGSYVNYAGNTVCSPYQSTSAPAGATARCVDGTYSFSQSRSGTCSHHGGVAAWL